MIKYPAEQWSWYIHSHSNTLHVITYRGKHFQPFHRTEAQLHRNLNILNRKREKKIEILKRITLPKIFNNFSMSFFPSFRFLSVFFFNIWIAMLLVFCWKDMVESVFPVTHYISRAVTKIISHVNKKASWSNEVSEFSLLIMWIRYLNIVFDYSLYFLTTFHG